MKKGRNVRILAFLGAMILIVGVGMFANALVGNPISKLLAARRAETHVENTYGNTDFYIEDVSYSFKDGNYYAHIKSPTSVDCTFALCIDMGGRLKWDGYEDSVLSGQNTANRLYMDYRKLVDTVLESPSFPFAGDIGYGDLQIGDREYIEEGAYPEYTLPMEDFELDGVYDIRKLGEKAGLLVLYVQAEEVSAERASDILLELKELMEGAGVPFYAIDFVLEYPRPKEGEPAREGRIEVNGFLMSDIYEEGMVERVREADEATRMYYQELDAKEGEAK